MLHYLAQHIRQCHEPLIERWMVAVRREPDIPTADSLADAGLRDHLDGLLAELAEQLSAAGRADPENPQAQREARKHGDARWKQHYRVDELLREIAVLRAEFLAFFSEYLKVRRQIDTEEFLRTAQIVHRFFDSIATTSVACYVQEREQQSGNTQQALQMLNATLAKANQDYESTDQSRRRTLRTVAHELVTPVNALGLGVTYLVESDSPVERQEAQLLISRTLEHLRTMLDQLVDFARADGGMERLKIAEFPVRPLFEYLAAGFEPLAAAKDLEFQAELDPGLGLISSDENKVQRIAVNLLSNAIKYTDSGSIGLALQAVGPTHWQVVVTDTGCGIPENELMRIFAEFQRLPAHSDRPGLGLGLSIVRTLAERLGGDVKVDSKMGQGSRFTVVLPRRI